MAWRALVYGTSLSPARVTPGKRFELLQRQYLQAEVLDSAGSRIQGNGGGGELPRTQPYAWHGQTNALIPGAGEYTLQFGCVSPPPPPTSKGSSDGVCIGGPIATIAIAVNIHVTTSGFFTVPPLLNALLVLGADRLILSVDYPFADDASGRAFLDAMPVSPTDREKVAHGNAERLLRL